MSNENAEVSGANSDPFEELVDVLNLSVTTKAATLISMKSVELIELMGKVHTNGSLASNALKSGKAPSAEVIAKLDPRVVAVMLLKGAHESLKAIGDVAKAVLQAEVTGQHDELIANAKIADSVIDEYPEASEAELMKIMTERARKRGGRPPEPESFNPLGRAFGGDK